MPPLLLNSMFIATRVSRLPLVIILAPLSSFSRLHARVTVLFPLIGPTVNVVPSSVRESLDLRLRSIAL